MIFDFKIVDDDVTDYLNKLEELSKDKDNKRRFLKDAGYELHSRYIAPIMPTWNPNLIESPMEAEHQLITYGESISSIELLYTGFTELERTYGLSRLFPQFAQDGNIYSGKLERDYAYFQETGIDWKVSPKVYKPKHLHFVERGTKEYSTEFHYKTMAYLEKLLNLEKWERVSIPSFVYEFE